MMTVHYIASDLQITSRLALMLEAEDIVLQLLHDARFAWAEPKWNDVENLLLFTPFLYNGQYLSAEKIWAHYIRMNHPGIRFFTAGYSKVESGVDNHLDLLSLPNPVSGFFRKAGATAPHPVATSGGLQLHDKLARFFDGHGKESIFDVLSDITRLLGMAQTAAQRYGDSFESVKEGFLNKLSFRWTELKNRWNNYNALMLCLPVAALLRETDMLIAETDRSYMALIGSSERIFQEETLLNLLQRIHKLLLKVQQSCL